MYWRRSFWTMFQKSPTSYTELIKFYRHFDPHQRILRKLLQSYSLLMTLETSTLIWVCVPSPLRLSKSWRLRRGWSMFLPGYLNAHIPSCTRYFCASFFVLVSPWDFNAWIFFVHVLGDFFAHSCICQYQRHVRFVFRIGLLVTLMLESFVSTYLETSTLRPVFVPMQGTSTHGIYPPFLL